MQPEQEGASGAAMLAELILKTTAGPIFHVPGEGILELLNAIEGAVDRKLDDASAAPSRLFTCRHENAAVTMAGVCGAMRNAPGVCLLGRAPGALNAALALHSCRTDETPVLLVVGDCAANESDRDFMLGEPLVAALRAITGHAAWCPTLDRLEATFATALNAAMLPRRGVGVLVVADNVWHERTTTGGWPTSARPPTWPRITPPLMAEAEAKELVLRMQASERPLVIVGGGTWSAQETEGLRVSLERLRIPAVAAYRCNDILASDSDCSVGELGIGADPSVLKAVDEADFVLLMGARLSELNTFGSENFQGFRLLRGAAARSIAMVAAQLSDLFQAYPVDLAICGQPACVIEVLDRMESRDPWETWRLRLRQAREDYVRISAQPAGNAPDPRELMATVNALAPPDCIFTVGAGRYAHLPQRYIQTNRPQRYFGPKSGAMGYGLPAAIGAALTDRATRAICFAGDGCFAMSGFELATARLYDASVTCIIFNDSRYSAIAGTQNRLFGREVGTDLSQIDFAALAHSMGVPAKKVRSQAEFEHALRAALTQQGPFVIEVPMRAGVCFAG